MPDMYWWKSGGSHLASPRSDLMFVVAQGWSIISMDLIHYQTILWGPQIQNNFLKYPQVMPGVICIYQTVGPTVPNPRCSCSLWSTMGPLQDVGFSSLIRSSSGSQWRCRPTALFLLEPRLRHLIVMDGGPNRAQSLWDQNCMGRPWVHLRIHGPDFPSSGPQGPTTPSSFHEYSRQASVSLKFMPKRWVFWIEAPYW